MPNKHKITRFLSTLLLLGLLGPALAACRAPDATAVASRMAQGLSSREYPRLYQLLTDRAKSRITLADFNDRYESIYGSFGLTELKCTVGELRDQTATSKLAMMQLDITSDKLGQFELTLEVPLVLQNGVWKVEWTPACVLPGMEEGDKAALNIIPARRGEIFDRSGNLLARNTFALSVYVQTGQVQDYEMLIRSLAPKLSMTESAVRNKLNKAIEQQQKYNRWLADNGAAPAGTATPTAIASPAPSGEAGEEVLPPKDRSIIIKTFPRDGLTQAQREDLQKIPGVLVDDNFMTQLREYPYYDLLCHVLGYTGLMDEKEQADPKNAALPKDARIGKDGLEQAYESSLRALPGYELAIVKANGAKGTVLARKDNVDGQDLRLTIDLELQQRAELLLRQYLKEDMAGSVVVMDPKTGYVQAMASYPSYDPNAFSFPIAAGSELADYFSDPFKTPLYNRATKGLYPPGSTFKPFTAVMGLQDDKITKNFVFNQPIENNYWTPDVNGWVYPPIKRMTATPGALNLGNAITYSDNIYFAYVAMQVGNEPFVRHCTDFGLNETMKFDLPVMRSKISNEGAINSMKTLADSGYGQGELLVTPLQMATLFGSLANGGDIMQPRLVQSVCHTEGTRYVADITNPKEVWKSDVIQKTTLDTLMPSLKNVAKIGTAKVLNTAELRKYGICAKTGTAQIGTDKTREIAWIIGFTTEGRDGDDRLVCVTVEVPADEGNVRTDIVKPMFLPTVAEQAAWDEKDKENGKEKGN